jgi:predicted ATPase
MALRIRQVEIAGYRSLRAIRFPVGGLTVFVGANGVGKTNLYRALQLIQAAAAGTLASELAAEGGMESALWAGKRQSKQPARIRLAVELAAGAGPTGYGYEVESGVAHSYAVEAGVRAPLDAAFALEPQIKEERLVFRSGRRAQTLLERRGPAVFAIDDDERRRTIDTDLLASETALGAVQDAGRFPDIDVVRRTMLSWRFYHDLRTDRSSPLRQPCLAVTTPTLASDGSDLAAVFATLVHIREDTNDLDRMISDAFPGAVLTVPPPGRTASFGLTLPEYPKRVFEASELSDGTLRYLGLAGALLGYRLPAFVALNEPEASLHPELLEPLARLIIRAAQRSQIWVVTHSEKLASAFAQFSKVAPRQVIKRNGETWIEGLGLGGDFKEEAI